MYAVCKGEREEIQKVIIFIMNQESESSRQDLNMSVGALKD